MYGKINGSSENLQSQILETLKSVISEIQSPNSKFADRLNGPRPKFDENQARNAFRSFAGAENILQPKELIGALKPFITNDANGKQVFTRENFIKAAKALGIQGNAAERAFEALADGNNSVPADGVVDFASDRARPDGSWRFPQFRDVVRDLANLGKRSAPKPEPDYYDDQDCGYRPPRGGYPGTPNAFNDKRRFDEDRTRDAFGSFAGADDQLGPKELLGALKPFTTTGYNNESVFERDGFTKAATALGLTPEAARQAFETLSGGKKGIPTQSVVDFAGERAQPDGTWQFLQFRDVVRDLSMVGKPMGA
jgi:hypothetical protein